MAPQEILANASEVVDTRGKKPSVRSDQDPEYESVSA